MPTAGDQLLGVGDGSRTAFKLVKHYGDDGGSTERQIAKPQAGSVIVSVNGVALGGGGYSVDHATGIVTLAAAPGSGIRSPVRSIAKSGSGSPSS